MRPLAALLVLALPAFAPAQVITSTWNGTTGNWTNPALWAPAVPNNGTPAGATYNATVNGAGAITLDQAIAIQQLNFSAGTITGPNSLTMNTGITWTGGTLAGSGGTFANGNNTLTAGAGGLALDGRTLTLGTGSALLNNGAGGGDLTLRNGGVLANAAGSSLAAFPLANMTIANGGGAGNAVTNAGTFQKVGAADLTIQVPFTSPGALTVAGGTLALAGGSTAGPVNVSGGATLRLNGSFNFTPGPGAVLTNFGTVAATAGTVDIGVGIPQFGTLAVSGATVNLPVSAVLGGLNFTAGQIGLTNGLTVRSGTWSGGVIVGAGDVVMGGSIAPAAAGVLIAGRTVQLVTPANQGPNMLGGVGNVLLGDNGVLQVTNFTDVRITTDTDILSAGGAGPKTVLNQREIWKTGGTGVTEVGPGVTFTNQGTLRVSSGTLRLSGPITNFAGGTLTGGFYEAQANSALDFNGRTVTTLAPMTTVRAAGPNASLPDFTGMTTVLGNVHARDGGTFTFTGPSLTVVGDGDLVAENPGANLVIPDAVNFTNLAAGTLTGGSYRAFNGGTINFGSRAVTANNAFITIAGEAQSSFPAIAGLMLNNGRLLILSGQNHTLNNGFVNTGTIQSSGLGTLNVTGLTNAGTISTDRVRWTGSADIVGSGGTWNSGTFDIQTDRSFTVAAGTPVFTNGNVFRKSVGGTTTMGWQFNQSQLSARVEVQTGMLNFAGGGSGPGTFVVSPGAGLRFSANYNVSGAQGNGSIANAGTLEVSALAVLSGGQITTSSGGRVQGTGTIANPMVFQSGSTLAPGTSPGILTATGPVTLGSNVTFAVELNGPTPGNGPNNHDQLNLAGGGSINVSSALLTPSLNYTPSPGDALAIITGGPVTGTFSGLPDGHRFLIGFVGSTGYNATIDYTGNSVVLLSIAPVPEPGTFVLCGGAAVAGFFWHRRRKCVAAAPAGR